MTSDLVVLVELHNRTVAATAPSVQVELELYMKYRTNGGANLVDILSRYPDIYKQVEDDCYALLLLTIFCLTLDHVLIDDNHRDSGLRL